MKRRDGASKRVKDVGTIAREAARKFTEQNGLAADHISVGAMEVCVGMMREGLLVPGTDPDGNPALDLTEKGMRELGDDVWVAFERYARRHRIDISAKREQR